MTSPRPARPPVFRFAPSPNGFLHLGHALSALTCAKLAERFGGRLLVRIEDIDVGRCREAFVEGIFEDLAWLGLVWEPEVWRQSERFADYESAALRLRSLGLLYPCFATRAEIARAVELECAGDPAGGDGPRRDPDGAPLYPELHRSLSQAQRRTFEEEGRQAANRLDMVKALETDRRLHREGTLCFTRFDGAGVQFRQLCKPERWGDVVIQRKDVPTSYHLAVVVDDAAQGVTHVVRGQDLNAVTDVHVLLQRLLGLPTPLYHFHRLLLDESGRKLSKSDGATSLRSLREAGASAADVRHRLGFD